LKEGGLASMLHFPINGHTVPAIEAFEKLASELEVPLYRSFMKVKSRANFRIFLNANRQMKLAEATSSRMHVFLASFAAC
jgi:hypothetical protein